MGNAVKLEPEMVTVIKNLDEQVREAKAVLARYEDMFNAQLRICARAMGLDPDLQIFDRASASFSPITSQETTMMTLDEVNRAIERRCLGVELEK